jgi:hypothetical protein
VSISWEADVSAADVGRAAARDRRENERRIRLAMRGIKRIVRRDGFSPKAAA